MDDTSNNTNYSGAQLRLAYRSCEGELKKKALERFLSVLYRRPVTLESILETVCSDPRLLQNLGYGGMAMVAEDMIALIARRINRGEGGERRFRVVERYFGLDGNMPGRLSAMSTKYGISRERVRQIKERALSMFRYKQSIGLLESELLSLCFSRAGAGAVSPRVHEQSEMLDSKSSKRLSDLRHHRELLMAGEPKAFARGAQILAFETIERRSRVLISGCAGSGKSWIALVTAQRLAREGKRTLLTCFNRGAADYFSTICDGIGGLTVASFHSLCLRLGKEAGIEIPGGWNSRVWQDRFPEVLLKAVQAKPELRFDAIIIDDGQEMRKNWSQALEAILSVDQGRLYCFADRNLEGDARGIYTLSMDERVDLTVNMRTPSSMEPLLFSRGFNSNGSRMLFHRNDDLTVQFYRCDTDESVRRSLHHIFTEVCIEGGVAPCDVAVLTPRLPKYSSAFKCRMPGKVRLVRSHSTIENHARLERIHTFQGLEREVVILVDLDDRFCSLSDSELEKLLYLGCSRHTRALFMLGTDAALEKLRNLSSRITVPMQMMSFSHIS